ncbi:MAG: retroviral-like aspartic protease family protein [Candidatus Melainabacteria bacterium]|nr:retroviral-like aspartic protease family protein [Candidatus Melainabacteria bacterium]
MGKHNSDVKLRGGSRMLTRRVFVISAIVAGLLSGTVPSTADSPYDSGVKSFGQRNYQQALTFFSNAESAGKRDANTYYYKALCYQQLKEYTRARDLFTYVRTNFPDSDAAVLCEQALVRFNYKAVTPAPAASAASPGAGNQVQETVVPFTRYPTGSHIFVKVLVNGQPVTMMLDTGASITTFPQSVLTKAGVKVQAVRNALRVTGVGGETSASVGRVMIQFGEITQSVACCIQDDAVGGAAPETPLLGQTFLSAFNYRINYNANTIQLSRIRPDAVKKPKRGVAAYSRDQNVVPFTREGNLMLVVVKVNGRECEMIFDTGAANVNFSDKTLAALGVNVPINSRRQLSSGVGGNREGYGFSLDEVQMGSVVKNHVRASMASYSTIPKPLLGFSFLEGTDFIVDNESSVLRFWP